MRPGRQLLLVFPVDFRAVALPDASQEAVHPMDCELPSRDQIFQMNRP